jgi:hypothetical protein
MEPKSGKPPGMLFNPFAIGTQLALTTGEVILASARAAAAQANARKAGVIAPAGTPVQKREPLAAAPAAKRARVAPQSVPSKARRGKARSRTKTKARAKR